MIETGSGPLVGHSVVVVGVGVTTARGTRIAPAGAGADSNNNRSAFVNRFLERVCAFLYLTMDKSGLYRLSRPSQILNFLQEISRVSLKGSCQRFEIIASG